MKFQAGDYVVRPSLGLCKITAITRMEIDGETIEMYDLRSGEGATVRVPRSQAESGGFRYPLDEAGVERIYQILAIPLKPDEMDAAFDLDINEALETVKIRDTEKIAALVRLLYNKDKEIDLDSREKALFTAAMGCLSEEIAHLRRTIKGKITSELKKQMSAARKERHEA